MLLQIKQEEAKLEAVRRRILETSNHEPTSKQWADAAGMRVSSLDKILCRGRESRKRIDHSKLPETGCLHCWWLSRQRIKLARPYSGSYSLSSRFLVSYATSGLQESRWEYHEKKCVWLFY